MQKLMGISAATYRSIIYKTQDRSKNWTYLVYPPGNSGKKKRRLSPRKKEGESFSPQIARVQDGHVIMELCTKDLFEHS